VCLCRDGLWGLAGGGALTLDEAVRRWSSFTGAPLAEAVSSASQRPARLLGLPTGPRAGAPADVVLLVGDGGVRRVMRCGRWVD
jgi:N-acetylglucosamine-6-phosphate deacetylase